MEDAKRPRDNSSDDDDNSKRQKTESTAEAAHGSPSKSPTSLETFPEELFYEIFDYLTHFQVYEAFFNLNSRFRHLLLASNLPINIDLPLLSKSAWKQFNADFIKSKMDRISSLRICNPSVCDHVLSSFDQPFLFDHIKHLTLNNIEYKCLTNLLNQLSSSSSSSLLSLIITTVRDNCDRSEIYGSIFRLQALKYCKISLLTWNSSKSLPISVNGTSPIEHLIIKNPILANELESLLPHASKLRQLSLSLNNITFNALAQMCRKYLAAIEVMRFTLDAKISSMSDYADANKWEEVITSYLPNLRIFDIQYDFYMPSDVPFPSMAEQLDQFITPFWLARQWFFAYRFYCMKYGDHVLFYSTKSHRKSYLLSERTEEKSSGKSYSPMFNSVREISIENEKSVTSSSNVFPNVTQLELNDCFSTSCDSVGSLFNRILPLRQLTKLVIKCHHFSLRKMLDMLSFTPNLHTLSFRSIPTQTSGCLSIDCSEDFRRISETNMIRDVTFRDKCTLDKVKLLVALCPRVQYLSIRTSSETAASITRFLLDKNNANTRQLCFLRFPLVGNTWSKRFKTFIESESLIKDYTLTSNDSESYLWW